MGNVLAGFFQKAVELGSVKAKMRFVMLTRTTVFDAEKMPDTPDKIKLFENAFKELEKEFK